MRADLFRSLTRQFARRHAEDARTLEEALQNRCLERIRDLSHEIRGDAGNLGMNQLADLSHQMETASRAGRLPEQAIFLAWREELSRILTDVHSSRPDSSEANQPLDGHRAQGLLRRLLASLDVDLQEAFTCLQEMGEIVEATTAVPRYERFRQSLEEFEIDLVRHQSEEWLKELSWTVETTNPGYSS